MKKFLIITLLSILLSYETFASEESQSSLTFSEASASGKKNGCNLVFVGYGQDNVYKKGTPIVFWGSLFALNTEGKMGYGFKIGIADSSRALEYLKKDKGHLVQSDKINYAYFSSNKCSATKEILHSMKKTESGCSSSAGQESKTFVGEKGEFVAVYDLYSLFFYNLDISDKIEIGFNRKEDGMDNKLTLDLKDKENSGELLKFTKCSSEMAKDFLDKIK